MNLPNATAGCEPWPRSSTQIPNERCHWAFQTIADDIRDNPSMVTSFLDSLQVIVELLGATDQLLHICEEVKEYTDELLKSELNETVLTVPSSYTKRNLRCRDRSTHGVTYESSLFCACPTCYTGFG